MIVDIIEGSWKLYNALKDMAEEMKDNWEDYERLMERCEIFKDILETYHKMVTDIAGTAALQDSAPQNALLIPEEKQTALKDLKKCFEEIQKFHREFSPRSTYSSFMRLVKRKQYAKDLLNCHMELDRCTNAFQLQAIVEDQVRRQDERKKDLEANKKTFKKLLEDSQKELLDKGGNVEHELQVLQTCINEYKDEVNDFLHKREMDPASAEELKSIDDTLHDMSNKLSEIKLELKRFADILDNSPAAISQKKRNELKEAWKRYKYFDYLATINTWRNDDPNFEIFATYQSRWRKDKNNLTNLLEVNGKSVDPLKYSYEKYLEIGSAFREIKQFMEIAEKLASEVIEKRNGVKVTIEDKYITKDDIEVDFGLKKSHKIDFLFLFENIYKLKFNSTWVM
jgi:Mg2+ and Co2+ transporter CorA